MTFPAILSGNPAPSRRLPRYWLPAFFLLVTGSSVFSQNYTVFELSPLAGDLECSASALNNLGKIVGVSTDKTGKRRAVTWTFTAGTASAAVSLPSLGDSFSLAMDVNDSGQVAGQAATSAGALHACKWLADNTIVDLGSLVSGNNSMAQSINNRGDVAGSFLENGYLSPSGFVIQSGQFSRVGNPGLSQIGGINDYGVIGGVTSSAAETRPFLKKDEISSLPFLSLLSANALAQITRLNNFSQAVGSSLTSDGNERAVLWQNFNVTSLGDLGGNYSKAMGLNHFGQVVGVSLVSPPATITTPNTSGYTSGDTAITFNSEYERAFLWRNNSLVNLNNQISSSSGWILLSATGINDRGQIVGYGLKDIATGSQPHPTYALRAYLLNPNGDAAPAPALVAALSDPNSSFRQDQAIGLAIQSSTAAASFRVYLDGQLLQTLTQLPLLYSFFHANLGTHQLKIESRDNSNNILATTQKDITVRDIYLSEWKVKYYGSALSAPSANLADGDGDKIPNLMEYAFNLNPLESSSLPRLLSLDEEEGPVLSYQRRKAFAQQNLSYDIEYSTDLVEWFSAESFVEFLEVSDDGPSSPTETLTWKLVPPLAENPRVFLRIKVSLE